MHSNWNLVADIGGTNARFAAYVCDDANITYEFHHAVSEYPQFDQVLKVLMADIAVTLGGWCPPQRVCFAVACPVDNNLIRFTNSHWHFSRGQIIAAFNCQNVSLINDFQALAHGITELADGDFRQIGRGVCRADKPSVVLGAGTGLGVAALIPHVGGYQVIDSEGGHVDFAPVGDMQVEVLRYLLTRHQRVSLERLLSGPGLLNIYAALSSIHSRQHALSSPSEVVEQAFDGSNSIAAATLDLFCEVLGSTAGNLALTYGARGGVYIAGGIVPRFADYFFASQFRQFFESKGRFASYLEPIPTYLVTHTNLGILGATKHLTAEGAT